MRAALRRYGDDADGCLCLPFYSVFSEASSLSLGFCRDARSEVHLFPLMAMQGRATRDKQPVPNALKVSESEQ